MHVSRVFPMLPRRWARGDIRHTGCLPRLDVRLLPSRSTMLRAEHRLGSVAPPLRSSTAFCLKFKRVCACAARAPHETTANEGASGALQVLLLKHETPTADATLERGRWRAKGAQRPGPVFTSAGGIPLEASPSTPMTRWVFPTTTEAAHNCSDCRPSLRVFAVAAEVPPPTRVSFSQACLSLAAAEMRRAGLWCGLAFAELCVCHRIFRHL